MNIVFLGRLRTFAIRHRAPIRFMSSVSNCADDAATEPPPRRGVILRFSALLNDPQKDEGSSESCIYPNAPKIPDPSSAVIGMRASLHNDILSLIRNCELDKAAVMIRHHLYSNCRPSVFTCNTVLYALLNKRRYADLLSLHAIIIQANVAPNVVTFDLLIQALICLRRTDTAYQHYRILTKDDSPITPSLTTYRVLTKALIENGNLSQALLLKDEMVASGFCSTDHQVYHLLMAALLRADDPDTAIALYRELSSTTLDVGAAHGTAMKAFFKKGMHKDAMLIYHSSRGSDSKHRFGPSGYNAILDALFEQGKLDDGVPLFQQMLLEHQPPFRFTVDARSFDKMIEMLCHAGSFNRAPTIFAQMDEKNCPPDVTSFNNIIRHLGSTSEFVNKAEEYYMEMARRGIDPDEDTYASLFEACLGQDRVEDATMYFKMMLGLGLIPTSVAFDRVIGGLVSAGRTDKAQFYFNMMVENQVKPNFTIYELLIRALLEARKLDDTLRIIKCMLSEEDAVCLSLKMRELIEVALKECGEQDLGNLINQVDSEKLHAAIRATEENEAPTMEEEEWKKVAATNMESAATANDHKADSKGIKKVGKKDSTEGTTQIEENHNRGGL